MRVAVFLLAWSWSLPALAAPELPSIDAITAKLNDLYRGSSSHGTMTMTINTKRYTRKLTMESWSKGDDYSLVVVRKPAREAGTATLRTPDGMWNYAPRADRMVRIPSGLLSESWMGSHLTNEDLMRESDYQDDYQTSLAWHEEDGKRRLQLTMQPKPEAAVVWTKIVQTLRPADWLPLKAEYYDQNEVVRVVHFKQIKTMNGRTIPTVMEVRPTDSPEEYTRLTYASINFNANVRRAKFTQRGLRRVAR